MDPSQVRKYIFERAQKAPRLQVQSANGEARTSQGAGEGNKSGSDHGESPMAQPEFSQDGGEDTEVNNKHAPTDGDGALEGEEPSGLEAARLTEIESGTTGSENEAMSSTSVVEDSPGRAEEVERPCTHDGGVDVTKGPEEEHTIPPGITLQLVHQRQRN